MTKKNSTVSLADEEQAKEVLASAVLGLWDVVNNLTRRRTSRRERYRVTIFGSARVKRGTFCYEATKLTCCPFLDPRGMLDFWIFSFW